MKPESLKVFKKINTAFQQIGFRFDEEILAEMFDIFNHSVKILSYLHEIVKICKKTGLH